MVYRVECKDCDMEPKMRLTKYSALQIAEEHSENREHTLHVSEIGGEEEITVQ